MNKEFILNIIVCFVAMLAFFLPKTIFILISGVTILLFMLIQKEYFLIDTSRRETRWSLLICAILFPLIQISETPSKESFTFLFYYFCVRMLVMQQYSPSAFKLMLNKIKNDENDSPNNIQNNENEIPNIIKNNEEEIPNKFDYLVSYTVNNFSKTVHYIQNIQKRTMESKKNTEYDELVNRIKAEVINNVQSDLNNKTLDSREMEKVVNDKLDRLNDSLSAVNKELSKRLINSKDEDNKIKLENSLNEILQQIKDKEYNIDSITDTLIDKLKDEKIDFANTKHIQNSEIRNHFIYAFKEAKEEINIISPWIGRWVLEGEFIGYIEKALKRGVTIKIVYGIDDNSNSNQRDDSSNFYAVSLMKKFKKYGKLFKMKKGNTHYKLLICDSKYYVAGSFNFLSFKGDYTIPNTRHEGADYSENIEQITFKRKMYFDF